MEPTVGTYFAVQKLFHAHLSSVADFIYSKPTWEVEGWKRCMIGEFCIFKFISLGNNIKHNFFPLLVRIWMTDGIFFFCFFLYRSYIWFHFLDVHNKVYFITHIASVCYVVHNRDQINTKNFMRTKLIFFKFYRDFKHILPFILLVYFLFDLCVYMMFTYPRF